MDEEKAPRGLLDQAERLGKDRLKARPKKRPPADLDLDRIG